MKCIVTTTIFPPSVALKKFAAMSDWHLVVAGDLKTPDSEYKTMENTTYLTPDKQQELYPKLSELIGWNCIQRRNIALLHAYKLGAEVVALVDDDNIPLDGVKRRTKIYNDSEIGRTARRRSHLKRYGLSIDNAVCMLSLQGGRCAICNRSLCDITTTNKKNEAPYVDHNHETGTVRSILCLQCNSGLGYFKDSPELLRTAAAYIERHNQPQVPNALR